MRPINISSNEVAPVNNALDKLAGNINAHVASTGQITGKNPFLKSLITSCFLLSVREMNIKSASLAKSDV